MLRLFRPEAIDHQSTRLEGEVVVPPRVPHSIILAFLLVWVIATVLWAASSRYARKETVPGWLEADAGVVRVLPESSGIIEQILVKEGDQVAEGQALAVVSGEVTLGDGRDREALLMQEYKKQQQILSDRLLNATDASRIRTLDVEQRISAARRNLGALNAVAETLESRYAIASSQLARAEKLHDSGFISAIDLEAARERALGLLNDKQSLIREEVSQRNTVEQLQADRALVATDSSNTIDQLKAQLSETALNVIHLSGQRRRIIKSPRSGSVTNLQAREGQQLNPQSPAPLMLIVAPEAKLTAQIFVPVRAIGFVSEGQQIEVRYDAFPYQKFGLYRGEITSISQSALTPRELLDASFEVREPVYKITARLMDQQIGGYGKLYPLKSGMTLSADIHLDERSLLEWLFDPVYTLKGKL